MSAPERLFVNLSTAIVGASGVVYAWMKYMMVSDDPFSVVNHPLQPWALDLHVLAAPVFVFAVGLIARDHILAQLRQPDARRGRATGVMAITCLLPMIATGYLVQVFTGETARKAAVAVHLVTGFVYLAFFGAHVALSWRSAARRAREGRQDSAPLVIGGARGRAGGSARGSARGAAPTTRAAGSRAAMPAPSPARRGGTWDGSPRS